MTSEPEIRAQCGNSARWELCGGGGPIQRAVPTTTVGHVEIGQFNERSWSYWHYPFDCPLHRAGRGNGRRVVNVALHFDLGFDQVATMPLGGNLQLHGVEGHEGGTHL